MFAKIDPKSKQVIKYPIYDLRHELPNISIPIDISSSNIPEGYVLVKSTEPPKYVPDQEKLVELYPIFVNDEYIQVWDVCKLDSHEIIDVIPASSSISLKRQKEYQRVSDPVFFKWQRGEATKEDWLAKVEQVRKKFPKP